MASRVVSILRPFTSDFTSIIGAEFSEPFAQQAVTTSINSSFIVPGVVRVASFSPSQLAETEFRFSSAPSTLGCNKGLSSTIGGSHTTTLFRS